MFEDGAFLSLLWVTVCAVVIIGLAYWFTRFVAGRNGLGGMGAGHGAAQIKVLARSPVGKDQTLLLVQVEQRYFLLGAAPGGLSTLAEFTPEEAEAWPKSAEASKGGQAMSFQSALQTVIKQKRQR